LRENCKGDGGPYACNVTPIFDNTTAAGQVKVAMKSSNPTRCCVIYCGQQADGTAGAEMPIRGGRSNCPLDDILPPPAKNMMDDIGDDWMMMVRGSTQIEEASERRKLASKSLNG